MPDQNNCQELKYANTVDVLQLPEFYFYNFFIQTTIIKIILIRKIRSLINLALKRWDSHAGKCGFSQSLSAHSCNVCAAIV
jgi:hypothetical protein